MTNLLFLLDHLQLAFPSILKFFIACFKLEIYLQELRF